jgi:hypothetical protein
VELIERARKKSNHPEKILGSVGLVLLDEDVPLAIQVLFAGKHWPDAKASN